MSMPTLANGQGGASVRAAINAALAELYSSLFSNDLVSGNWYPSHPLVTTTTTSTTTLNVVYFTPLWIPHPCSIAALAAEVTTAVASSNFQLGVYGKHATTKNADGACLGNTTSLSGAATGVLSQTLATPIVISTPGWYWLGVNTDTSGIAFRGTNNAGPLVTGLIGSSNVNNVVKSVPGQTSWSTAMTFGTWGTIGTLNEQSSATRTIFGGWKPS